MLSKTKKILILSGMLVLLVVTGYLNVLLNSQASDADSDNVNNMTFFEMLKADRESDYNQDMLVYQGIFNTSEDETQKANAQATIMLIQQTYSKAGDLERLIIGRGFSDCFIHLSIDTPAISVFAKQEELNAESVAIILDVLVTQIGAKAIDVQVNPV